MKVKSLFDKSPVKKTFFDVFNTEVKIWKSENLLYNSKKRNPVIPDGAS